MAKLTAKEAKEIGNALLGWFFWAAHLALNIAALLIIAVGLLQALGVKINFMKVLGTTELAYAIGAYYLYRKA